MDKEQFTKEIENHKVTIIKDDGVHRHLHCSDGTFNMHFDIITYPGYLVVSGDVGSFVFKRTDDMFKFFRGSEINPNYWGEKLQSISVWGGYKKFSEEMVKSSINERIESFCEDIDYYFEKNKQSEYKDIESFEKAFRDEVNDYFKYKELDQYRHVTAIEEFESEVIPSIDFSCDWEWVEYEDYSTQYLWLLHGIVWAIAQYDEMTKSANAA